MKTAIRVTCLIVCCVVLSACRTHEKSPYVDIDDQYHIMEGPYDKPTSIRPCGPLFTFQEGNALDGYPAIGFKIKAPWGSANAVVSTSKIDVQVIEDKAWPSVGQHVDWQPGDPAPGLDEGKNLRTVIRLSAEDLRDAPCLQPLRKRKPKAAPPNISSKEKKEPEVLTFYKAPDGTQIAVDQLAEHAYRSADGKTFAPMESHFEMIDGGQVKQFHVVDPYNNDKASEITINGNTLTWDGKKFRKTMTAPKEQLLPTMGDVEPDASQRFMFLVMPDERGFQFLGYTGLPGSGPK